MRCTSGPLDAASNKMRAMECPYGHPMAREKCRGNAYCAGLCALLDEEPVPETDELLDAPASPADGAAAELDDGAVADEAPEESILEDAPAEALLGLFTVAPDDVSPMVPEAPALPSGDTVPVAEPLTESMPDAEPEAEPLASGWEVAHAASVMAHAKGNIHFFIRSPLFIGRIVARSPDMNRRRTSSRRIFGCEGSGKKINKLLQA